MNTDLIPILELASTPRERGRIHGEACRDRIAETLDAWKQALGDSTGLAPNDYLARFLGDTRFLPTCRTWTPGLVEEVEGIAEAARQPFDLVFAWQLMDEQWWHARDLGLGLPPVEVQCSALGVERQGELPPMVAQNLDMPEFFQSRQVLLHIIHDGPPHEVYVVSWVGYIGSFGVNRLGVANCGNTVQQLDGSPLGLPVAFVNRGFLERTSLADAVAFGRAVPHASGQNYVLGGPEGIADLECSARSVVEYRPVPGAGRLAHTNHPIANHDTERYEAAFARGSASWTMAAREAANTRTRFTAVERRLLGESPITVESIQAILSSHDSEEFPVCRHNENGYTCCSLVSECGPAPALHVAFGPPCTYPYRRFAF